MGRLIVAYLKYACTEHVCVYVTLYNLCTFSYVYNILEDFCFVATTVRSFGLRRIAKRYLL